MPTMKDHDAPAAEWLEGLAPGTPLHELIEQELDAHPLAFDEGDAADTADRLARRLSAPRRSRLPWLAAAAAVLAIGAWTLRDEPVPAHVPAPAAPEARTTHVRTQPAYEATWRAARTANDDQSAWTVLLEAAREDPSAHEGWLEPELRRATVERHVKGSQVDTLFLDEAVEGYEAYLEAWPAGEHDEEMRYAAGEALFRAERFEDALEQYLEVVERYPEGKRARFCARAAVFTAAELVDADHEDGPEQLATAAHRYLRGWPDADDALHVRYRAGLALHAAERHAAAEAWFEEVVEHHPTSPEAVQAATLILEGYEREDDKAGLAARAAAFKEVEGLGDAAFDAQLDTLIPPTPGAP